MTLARVPLRNTNDDRFFGADLSASDPQTTGFVNSSYPNMRSAVAMAFAFLLDPEVAKNDGRSIMENDLSRLQEFPPYMQIDAEER